jgi:hypothetical protein
LIRNFLKSLLPLPSPLIYYFLRVRVQHAKFPQSLLGHTHENYLLFFFGLANYITRLGLCVLIASLLVFFLNFHFERCAVRIPSFRRVSFNFIISYSIDGVQAKLLSQDMIVAKLAARGQNYVGLSILATIILAHLYYGNLSSHDKTHVGHLGSDLLDFISRVVDAGEHLNDHFIDEA